MARSFGKAMVPFTSLTPLPLELPYAICRPSVVRAQHGGDARVAQTTSAKTSCNRRGRKAAFFSELTTPLPDATIAWATPF